MDRTKIYNTFCCTIGLLGILLFAFSIYFQPGIYHGSIQGRFDLSGQNYTSYFVNFESETTSQWRWRKPENFSYNTVHLELDNFNSEPTNYTLNKVTIYFPSLLCKHQNGETSFTQEFLIELLNPDNETLTDTVFWQQINEIFTLILSAGNGSAPKPRHHLYDFDSPFHGFLVHFSLGSSFLPFAGILLLAIAIILWIIQTLKDKQTNTESTQQKLRHLITPFSIIVLANSCLFIIGVLLNFFGGWIDALGAFLCTATPLVGIILVPISILYAFIRRYKTKYKQWDILGLSLLVLSFMMFYIILGHGFI